MSTRKEKVIDFNSKYNTSYVKTEYIAKRNSKDKVNSTIKFDSRAPVLYEIESEYEYLIRRFKQDGLLDEHGNKTIPEGDFDPWIYPDEGYIPHCTECKTMYEKFLLDTTVKEVEAKHLTCGCLWYEWFKTKILRLNPNVKMVRPR